MYGALLHRIEPSRSTLSSAEAQSITWTRHCNSFQRYAAPARLVWDVRMWSPPSLLGPPPPHDGWFCSFCKGIAPGWEGVADSCKGIRNDFWWGLWHYLRLEWTLTLSPLSTRCFLLFATILTFSSLVNLLLRKSISGDAYYCILLNLLLNAKISFSRALGRKLWRY